MHSTDAAAKGAAHRAMRARRVRDDGWATTSSGVNVRVSGRMKDDTSL